MRKIIMPALLLTGLAGCAMNPYGNYATASLDHNQQMADATAAQLIALYPPAHTRFNLQQPTTDAYGTALVQAIRNKGYALQEYAPQGQARTTSSAAPASSAAAQDQVETAKHAGNEKRKNTAPETTTKESKADDLAKNIQTDTPRFNSVHAKATPDSKLVAKPVWVWTLDDNHTILQNLKNWANKAGWKIIWNLHHDWAVPASTRYTGEFSEAAGNVIKTLAANGALVRVKFYEGNKTMVVNGHGANAL